MYYDKSTNFHKWNELEKIDNCIYNEIDWKHYKKYVSLLIKYSNPGKWVDLGCGNGAFVECCDFYGINVEGLEGDAYAVETGNKRINKILLKQYNINEKLPYKNNEISTIFCNQVLEHLDPNNNINFLKECYRVLKEEGVLL
jgi:2-polyprenyl-3-methyl-5-hydroxy-6-metoxy-1,4-benzoquinol methylase